MFAFLCGLLGEAVEVARLETGGMSPPEWALRVNLVGAYAVAAALLLGAVALFRRRPRTTLTLATAGFGVLLVLPWLNFDYLPQFRSAETVLGSVVAVVAVAVVAPVIPRFPVTSAGAVLLMAVCANATGIFADGGRQGGSPAGERAAGPVNVIVVVIDTLRADHLGAYGYGRPTSSNFDALAHSSVLFENAVAQASWTKPSIASLMTGSYVHHHGVVSSRDALGSRLPTLAEKLRATGYRTAAFSGNPWITPEFRFDRGFQEFESNRAMCVQLTNLYRLLTRIKRLLRHTGIRADVTGWVFWASAEANASNSERDARLTDALIEWLDKNSEDPFFVYFHLIGPHDPYDPPPEFAQLFRDSAWNGVPVRSQPPPRVQSIFEAAAPLDEISLASLLAQYDGAIAFADFLLGRITTELERLNLLDRTLLVITSDHGEEFYEHGNWRHGNQLYNEVIRVPLIIRFANRLTPGRRTDPAMLVDIFPTILDLLGVPLELPHKDGRNLFARQEDGAGAVFSEHWRFEGGKYASWMVLHAGMKLKRTHDTARGLDRLELYDLGVDPSEQQNLLGNGYAVNQNDLGALKGLLAGFASEMPMSSVPAVEVGGATKERLRALGY